MSDILHLCALAPAAASACCVAADHRRVRAPELTATVVMLLAMVDGAIGGVVAPVYWAGLLMAAAVAVAACRSPRRKRTRPAASSVMTLHTTLGLVVMAGLMLAMSPAQSVVATAHGHGTPAAVVGPLAAGAAGFAAWSAIEAARAHRALDRAQLGAMGLSALVMGIAVLS